MRGKWALPGDHPPCLHAAIRLQHAQDNQASGGQLDPVRFTPPLVITEEQLMECCRIITLSVRQYA